MKHSRFPRKKILILFIILCLGWSGGYFFFQKTSEIPLPQTETPKEVTEGENSITTAVQQTQGIAKAEEKNDDDIIPVANRSERAHILAKKAEFLSTNNEYSEALKLYERVLRLEPSADTERKAAHTAFRAKKFQKSADLYKKNLEALTTSEKVEFMNALRYTGDEDFAVALANLPLPDDIKKAFEVSWTCETEFISCETAIRSYKYDYAPINELKNALKNYEALANNDTNYKEALLIGAWYKNGDYTTVIKVWENLLRRKPDYRPILKIVGFSSYIIGSYDRSQAALNKYKKLEPKDPEVDFILGLINFEKSDYETSNIYFNNAVLGGYKPKTVVERKLAYNYYVLGLTKNMFQVLGYLVLEPDVTEYDINNAIYLALSNNETRSAGEWIKKALEKFPDSLDLGALRGWDLRITNNVPEAKTILADILTKNPNHLLALIESGINAYNEWDKVQAKTFFKKAQIINAGGTWSEIIEGYLGKL